MKMNLKPMLLSAVCGSLLFSNIQVFAAETIVEGETKIQVSDPVYNTNPWNTARVTGVGEGNEFILMTSRGNVVLPLEAPLYKVTDYYRDRIVERDGVWGVERMVGVMTFDGSEPWELFKKQSFNNNKTVIFSAETDKTISVRDGVSTHFDVYLAEDMKETVYDGISFSADGKAVYMRFMNVRGINTPEGLKEYLKTQKDNGNPVKLFYIMNEATFEPFDNRVQAELNALDKSTINGYVDFAAEDILVEEVFNIDETIFTSKDSGNPLMNRFMSAVTDCVIYGGADGLYINALSPNNEGLTVALKDNKGKTYESVITYADYSFTTGKSSEVLFNDGDNLKVRLLIDLGKIEIPETTVTGFSYLTAGFKDELAETAKMVLPDRITAGAGETLDFNNSVVFHNGEKSIVIRDSEGNILSENGLYTVSKKETVQISFGGETYEVEISLTGDVKEEKTILFLGDSLINQDFYTSSFAELFNGDTLTLTGTRGTEGNQHEGRGGWAAYDYCNVESKYGFTNPFLNGGKFDFTYYMNQIENEKLDAVVVNLGINDLNLKEHNSHEEIVKYLDEMFQSIRAYDEKIQIVLNTPIMPYGGSEETAYAKEKRLAFIEFLMDYYSDEDILLSNVYLKVNHYDDFKFVQPRVNEDQQDLAMVVTDTTHLNNFGYRSMARSTYSDIASLEK